MLMYILALIAIVATVLNIVVLVSTSDSQNVVKDLEWAHGELEDCNSIFEPYCFDLFVGVYHIIFKSGGYQETTDWGSDSCDASYCADCESSMMGSIAFAFIACILGLPSIFTNFMRGTANGNTPTNRSIGCFSAFCAMICALISVIWSEAGCLNHVRDDTEGDYTWTYGPAWALILTVFILQFINFVGNVAHVTGSGGVLGRPIL